MSNNGAPAPEESPSSELADASSSSPIYRAVWRWHFYAGIFAIPVLVILALSGIVYLFRFEIGDVLHGHMMTVEQGQTTVSYEHQFQSVQAAYPETSVVRVVTPSSPTLATAWDLDDGRPAPGHAGGSYTAFVDPYTGEVLGRRDNHRDPAQIANQIHGSMLTGHWLGDPKWGDRFVELVASWTVVLIATGIFLWWPRGSRDRGLRGVLIPRLNVRAARIKWRDIHSITGVLFAFVFLFFILTGLAWSGFWGTYYKEVATRTGADFSSAWSLGAIPSRTVEGEHGIGHSGWAQSALPVLPSRQPLGEPTDASGLLTWDPAGGAPLDAIVANVQAQDVPDGFSVSLPWGEDGSYFVSYGFGRGDNIFEQRAIFVDQYTAEILLDMGMSDFGPAARITDVAIEAHQGTLGGIFGKLLSLGATLALLVVLASSVVMWFKRRPQGIGAPRRVYSRGATVGLVLIMLTIGVIFPMVGLSMIALFIFDFLFLRNIPPLARALNI